MCENSRQRVIHISSAVAVIFLREQVAGFRDFLARIEGHAKRHPYPIAVAMEAYNGHVRPLDSLVKGRGWRRFRLVSEYHRLALSARRISN